MTGLREPPKEDRPSRAVARVLALVFLVGVAGIVIYSAVINQRIDVTETTRLVDVERQTATVDGFAVNLFDDATGRDPVVFLHDDEMSGSLTLADLSATVGNSFRTMRIDLPGFGLSDRIPDRGPMHTVSGMADTIADAISQTFLSPVVLVGVGFGGEVAAEIAHVHGDLVSGLVLVNSDFDRPPTFAESLASLPWLGRAATYTWETGGRLADSTFAPFCAQGGWCPTPGQLATRAAILEIAGSTNSLNSFRRTPTAAIAPSNLEEIAVPIAYVWSTSSGVSEASLDLVRANVRDLTFVESDSFQAHLEDHESILRALEGVTS